MISSGGSEAAYLIRTAGVIGGKDVIFSPLRHMRFYKERKSYAPLYSLKDGFFLCGFGRRLEEAGQEASGNRVVLKQFEFPPVARGDGELD
jgi:hypothetical protein